MFTTDSRTENFLRYMGVQFEFQDAISYSELDANWKTANLGRQNALNDDAILEYATMMERGSPAPAPITFPDKRGHIPLDGVQRLSAGETLGLTRFPAYVVAPKTSLVKQHQLRIFANARINGQHTPDKTFVLSKAVEILYFQDHCSEEEIAKGCGLPIKQVREEIRFQITSIKLQNAGYEGKMIGRNKKWFSALVGQYADSTDFEIAPGPIVEMVRTVEKCGFKNGQTEHLIADFFDVKRSARKDRHEQFTQKVASLKNTPEVRVKLKSDHKKCHLDQVVPALRRANSVLESAIENEELVHDPEFANLIADCVRLVYVNCRKVVPRDLQFHGGRNSSIFDKG